MKSIFHPKNNFSYIIFKIIRHLHIGILSALQINEQEVGTNYHPQSNGEVKNAWTRMCAA